MTKSHSAVVGITLASILALSACSPMPSAVPSDAETEASAVANTPSPEPTPTEVALSIEEAGARYLGVVCDSNAGVQSLAAAFDASEQEYLAGGAPDPAAVKAAAAQRIADNRTAIELLDDEYYVWPDEVAGLIPLVRDSLMSELSTLSAMANAATYEDAYYATFPGQTAEQQSAGQEIRYALGLSADTTASCEPYLGQSAVLHEEMLARG